jgi:hypothetical protein
VGAIVVVTALTIAPAAQAPTPIFSATGAARVEARQAARGRVRRTRAVAVNRAVLAALMQPGAAARPPFSLNVFDDVAVPIARERLERGPHGHASWVGHVPGDPTSAVSLTWNGRTLAGGLVTAGRAFDLQPAGDGVVMAVERDMSGVPPELPPLQDAAAAAAGTQAPPPVDAALLTIDLLVYYTPAARDLAGGIDAITAQLVNAVAVTNAAFARSGVRAAMRAVGLEELPYTESAVGIGADLLALEPAGLVYPQVEARRQALGADLVTLVTGRSVPFAPCGIAFLGPGPGATRSVSEQSCLYAGQWSFTHELAHNFGAHHAPGDSFPDCVPYACGYREGPVRTLMAYPRGDSPPRVLHFSSSVVREPGSGAPTGTSLQDNARRLNDSTALVASHRLGPLPGAPREFTAEVDGTTVTLGWMPPEGGAPPASYLLEVGNAPGAGDLVRMPVAASPLVVPGVPPGTYFARLRSVAAAGAGAPTADVTIHVAGCTAPGPLTLAVQQGGPQAVLTWTAPATGNGPFTFTLGAGSVPGALDRGVFPMGVRTSFTVTPPPGRYYVRAIAANACGASPISNEVLVTVP